MAELVVKDMKAEGTNIHEKCVPTAITKEMDNTLSVTWLDKNSNTHNTENGFNTVMMAIGKGSGRSVGGKGE